MTEDKALLKNMHMQELSARVMTGIYSYGESLWGHCIRTANLSKSVAEGLGVSNPDTIFLAAMTHDVGKLFIDPRILNKPGSLNDKEREIVDMHSVFGYSYLKSLGFPEGLCLLVLLHHGYTKEKYNVDYMKGDFMGADIIRACDIYDAVTHNRPYHVGVSKLEALKILDEQTEKLRDHIIEVLEKVA